MEWTNLFSTKGRLAQGPYWKLMGASFALSAIGAWWLMAVVVSAAFNMLQGKGISLPWLMTTLSLSTIMTVVFSWVLCNCVIKRLHDAGQSGWWTLLMFVPSGSLIVPVVAGVLPEVPGPTPYDD